LRLREILDRASTGTELGFDAAYAPPKFVSRKDETRLFPVVSVAFTVSPFCRLTVENVSRYGVHAIDMLYSERISSLAGDLRVPAKNRGPRAIARIADALFFSGGTYSSAAVVPRPAFAVAKKEKSEGWSRSYGDHLIDPADGGAR